MQLVALVLFQFNVFILFCAALDRFETGGVGKCWGGGGNKTQSPSGTHYMAALFFSAAKTQLI